MLAGVYQLWSREIILKTIRKVCFKKQLKKKKKIRAAGVGGDDKQQKLTRSNSLKMEGGDKSLEGYLVGQRIQEKVEGSNFGKSMIQSNWGNSGKWEFIGIFF